MPKTEEMKEQDALKALGIKESSVDFRKAGLDKKFANTVIKRQQIKIQMDALKSEMNELTAEIGAAVMESGYKSVLAGDYRVTVSDKTNRSLSKEKLLELGVSAQTILAASKESHSSSVTITEIKKEEE